MFVRNLSRNEILDSVPMIWKVFCECEASDYPEEGKSAFLKAVSSESYISQLVFAFGAFEEGNLIGLIAFRDGGKHLALFFVEKAFQRKGVGKLLFETALKKNPEKHICVNSSLFAVRIYEKLGFTQDSETLRIKEESGIRYVQMEYVCGRDWSPAEGVPERSGGMEAPGRKDAKPDGRLLPDRP